MSAHMYLHWPSKNNQMLKQQHYSNIKYAQIFKDYTNTVSVRVKSKNREGQRGLKTGLLEYFLFIFLDNILSLRRGPALR